MPSKRQAQEPMSPRSAADRLFSVLSEKYPAYRSQLESANNLTKKAIRGLDAAAPAINKGSELLSKANAKATELDLHQYVPMLVGLAVCFFGGQFTLLIAAVEAVRLVCWEDIQSSFAVLRRNYEVAAEQNRKDNAVDADGNGIADVLEIDSSQLMSRKIALLLKSIDLDEVRSAGRTFLAALFSVLAALRMRTARSVALASSLASMAQEAFPVERVLEDALPPEYKKLSGLAASSIFYAISFSCAVVLRSAEAAVHCAMRGAYMFVCHALEVAKRKKLLQDEVTMESLKPKVLVGIVAAMGFLMQMSSRGGAPFPLNILLFPLSLMEWVLQVALTLLP